MNRRVVVYSVVAVTFLGCGSTKHFYEGPKRDMDSVTILDLNIESGARVVRIDDYRVSDQDHDGLGPACFTGRVALLPGTHTLEVLYYDSYYDNATPATGKTTMTILTSTDHKELVFDARPGAVYRIEAESRPAEWPPNAITWRTWIVEKESGELVAAAPPED
ncbi:MAG: hypothetical protein Kow0074_06290 [Candidatus Zixiibacteriota bacterium]